NGQTKAQALCRWQGGNRRRFEEAVGGKEGGCGEDGTHQEEDRCQEGGGEEGTREGGEESWREGIAEESGGEGFRSQSDCRAVEAALQIGRSGEYQAAVNRRKSPGTERVPLDLFSRAVSGDDALALPWSASRTHHTRS